MFKVLLAAATLFTASATFAQVATADNLADTNADSKWTYALQLPGLSHHFSDPPSKKHQWNERHPGLGFEWHRPWADHWTLKYSVGAMRDSVDSWEVQAGASLQRHMGDALNLRLEVGGGAFVFYRALKFNGPRQLVPAVLPVATVVHKPTGIGMNIVFVPEIKISGEKIPALVYAQFIKKF